MDPATTAVLDTYELLENIIAHLPPVDILAARKVCKTWRTLIKKSVRIRRARVVRPETRFLQSFVHCSVSESVPVYPHSARMRVNPVFRAGTQTYEDDEDQEQHLLVGVSLDGPIEFASHKIVLQEFVTSPPCRVVLLHTIRGDLCHVSCSIYNEYGVSVEDVFEIAGKLWKRQKVDCPDWDDQLKWATLELVGCQYLVNNQWC